MLPYYSDYFGGENYTLQTTIDDLFLFDDT